MEGAGTAHGVESIVLLLIAAVAVTVVAHWVKLSSTIALLLLGLALGAVGGTPAFGLSSHVILLLFLPPLLFEAAFVLDLRLLWDVRVGVLTLAIPGLLFAMAVGGALVHVGLGLPWTVALLFGAMLAATDPVAVLATFRRLGTDKRLTALVEGESLLNDGVALVVLIALVDGVNGGIDPLSVAATAVLSIAGGAAVGLATGWIGHLVIARVDEHLTEMAVSVAMAYGAFLAAEKLHLSGVLATVAAAMTLGRLGRTRGWIFSHGSERTLIDLWEFLAFAANAALFLLMGLTVRTSGLLDHPAAVVWGVSASVVARAAAAYGVGSLLDRLRFPLSGGERHVLFWGGLRGAVALAAALSLPAGFPHRAELLAMTYAAVLFTLLIQGVTIAPLVRRLGLDTGPPAL